MLQQVKTDTKRGRTKRNEVIDSNPYYKSSVMFLYIEYFERGNPFKSDDVSNAV